MIPFLNQDLKFTKSEKRLIEYIDKHSDEVIYESITELMEHSNVGNATIVRFCKKLGFEGYPEFKVALAHELTSRGSSDVFSGPIEEEDSIETVANKFYAVNVEALNSTIAELDYELIRNVASSIAQTERLHFSGIGHSGMTAQETKYKFMRIGFHSDNYTDEHTMLMMASIMNEGDTVFSISHSGQTKELLRMLETAQQNNATTICITGDQTSPVSDIADYTVHYISAESLFQTGAVSTKIAQLFVIDLIYTQVARLSTNSAIDKKIRTTQIIQSNT